MLLNLKVCREFRVTFSNVLSNIDILCASDHSSNMKKEPQKVLVCERVCENPFTWQKL